jgi:hypothetical protein
MEACFILAIAGITNYVIIRLVTPTNDNALDTKNINCGYQVSAVFKRTDQTILNCSEFFYNLNVPIKVLQNGYVFQCFLSLIILDDDEEETSDNDLSSNIECKNYDRLGMSRRPPLT